MKLDLIVLTDYCVKVNIEPSFVLLLNEEGLIEVHLIENTQYLLLSQLKDLERYTRMYYDLSINMEGIDVIHHLLDRMKSMQAEISHLKKRLRLYEAE
ncbi:MAG: chaperone modulator CbpM [Tannerellaceae bacterium]|nr:chaperone modulator CbpM [Tannerellaceae bacterium]